MSRFASAIIGKGSVMLACTEILQAASHDVRVCTSDSDLETELASTPIDWLFSIVNQRILSPRVLALPRAGTVNYHDGPLPRYAGVHATTWALLNDEASHAISWHLVTPEVDAGDILKQVEVPIEAGETAYTLNVRCAEAAIAAFRELVGELAENRFERRPQDPSKRTYFGRHLRPPGAAVLRASRRATELDRLVRALAFGRTQNPIATAKIVWGGQVLAVGGAQLCVASGASPGTIVATENGRMRVATVDGDLWLAMLSTLSGRELSAADLDEQLRRAPCIDEPDTETFERITAINEAASRREDWWVRRLGETVPPNTSWAASSAVAPSIDVLDEVVPPAVAPLLAGPHGASDLLAALGCVLARLGGQSRVDLAWTDAELALDVGIGLFAPFIPVRVEASSALQLAEVRRRAIEALDLIHTKRPYALDVFSRYPELRPLAMDLPIAVGFGARQSYAAGSMLTVQVVDDGRRWRWSYDASRIEGTQVRSLAAALARVLGAGATSVGDVPVLDDDELERVTTTWNQRDIARYVLGTDQRPMPVGCFGELWIGNTTVARADQTLRPDPFGVGRLYRTGDRARWVADGRIELGGRIARQVNASDREIARQLDYWKDQLRDAPETALPLKATQPPLRTFHGQRLTIELATDVSARLRELARREGATLFMTLSAAFRALLARYTGQDDLVIGTPIVNHRRESEGLIGLFVNTLVLRNQVRDDESFATLLAREKTVALAAYDHQDTPFEMVVESARRTPLQVVYAHVDAAEPDAGLAGLAMEWLAVETATAPFALSVTSWEAQDRLAASFLYNEDLFDSTLIEQMAGHYRTLLERVAADPSCRIGGIDLLDADERRRIVASASATEAPNDPVLVPLRFEAQAARTPDAIAVVYEAERLSYGELDRRANQLAHHLLALDARPDRPVAVLLDRSVENVVALLGILKAGAPYLPIDPSNPPDRIRAILEDSGSRLIVGHAGDIGTVRAVRFDVDHNALAARPATRPPLAIDPESLAYVIYTSGSTGRPKGVAIEHRGLANLVAWHVAAFEVSASSRATQIAALSFDASVWEIWPYLSCGASLHVVGDAIRIDPGALIEWLIANAVTHCFLPTPLAESMIEQPRSSALALSILLVGGQALTRRPNVRHRFRMINCYGPTENTVVATAGEVSSVADGTLPPIGRPIGGVRTYVLDSLLAPVPRGVRGELFLGGVQLARGYLGRADLTAASFVPDPFGPPGSRLYRTGDLAQWRADGNLAFLGRIDHQVKVRGFRIELGEIERVLGEHRSVGHAVVVARDGKELVAYVVPGDGFDATAIRTYLTTKLPEYMVPAALVTLATLPLSRSGKVDRKALPAPTDDAFEYQDYVAPRSATERTLVDLWRELLGVERVGVHDNFFALGGDSMMSIQLLTRARRAGLSVTAKSIFQHQTIAEMAADAGPSEPAVHAEQGEVTGQTPLTPIQRWFFAAAPADPHRFTMVTVLEVDERLDRDVLAQSLVAVATHHDALRLRFDRGDAAHEWRQRFTGTAASSVSLEVREHAPAAPTEVEELVRAANVAAHDALDVAAGPMLAARYLDLGGRGGRLVLVAHHLIIDQVSWSIVVDDLERAYRQLERGERVTLGAKTTSFKRWSERLAELGSAPERLADAAHWRALAEFVPQPIPVDHERGEMTVSTTRTVAASLDTEVTRRLLAEVPAAYRTQVNDVLLTALGEAFSACAGVDRLLVALEGHGREPLFDDVDLSRTVGWFTSMFPVALVRDRADPSSCLKATKEALRHIPHRGIGYGIHRELGEDRALRDTLAAAPTPQITFNYLGQMTAGHDRMFRVSPESAPQLWDPRLPQTSLLVVTCGVSEGRLQCTWDFSEARHRRETIEALATAFVGALERLVEHCTSPDHFGYTPSDFPLAGLGQAELDALIGSCPDIEDVYPLTPLQAGMLFHSLGDERSGVYVVQQVLSITELDRAALVAAFAALIERHSAFRTYVAPGSLLQVVVREADFALAEHDEPLDAFLREDRVRGFDLASAPLMRATLIRTGEQSGELVWTTHHVVTDGWSVGTVLADFLELYGAARAGRTASLPAVPRFRDYIAWLSSRAPDETNAFWQDRLAGFAAPTPLPIAGAVPLGWTADIQNGELQRRVSGLGHRVERAAKRHHTTASTLVHAAWGLLLARYTGEDDIVFGSVVSGRNAELPGVEHMIGALINTVPVRIVVGRHERISELLAHLHDDLTRSRAHEHISLTDAQRLSSVPAGTPLFHTLLAYENYPVDPAAAARRQALGITAVRGLEQTNFPLDVSVIPGDDLRLVVHYNQGLFTDAQIEQLVDHFIRVLAELAPEVGTTDRAVAEIDLLDADERRRIVAFASAAEAPSDPVLVPLRFEAQAARTPDAIAVVHEAERLSYGELDRRANQLAHHLLALDARPDRPVAVLLDRSVENVVALLGILKAGAPYLPIDPSNPPDRIRAILEDSGSRLIVGHAAGDIGTVRAVRFDVEHNALAARPATRPPLAIDPESLAYVIYTSGSTGRPKGVAIEHRGLANLVAWHVAAFEVSASSRATQIAALSFDASVWEIWPYLSCGASLHVVGDAIRIDPGALIEWLIANAVTHCFLPTPLAESMIEQPRSSALALSILLVGGQALTRRPNVRHRFRMINCYGPTENTVVATAGEVSSVADGTLPPIGRPIGGVRTYVLDSLLAPVPRGVRGELFLGGVQLARGYLGRADLTAASFVPDPFGPPGSRLYRTGDLAQWRADGNLAFLGRIDHQVKVRGFRIELGEIEAALRLQPSVRDAVVTARDDSSGDQRLVAYVIAREDCAVAVDALRHGLAATLPSYMVPSAFVVIEQFPMTSTGKIDRKALPAPTDDAFEYQDYVAPRSAIERTLVDLWRELLGVERVGVRDNFFALGGDSMMSIQLLTRARRAGLSVTAKSIFQHQTIAEMAADAGPSEPAVHAEQGEVTGQTPLTPIQRWFFAAAPADPHRFTMVTVLEVDERLDRDVLAQSLVAVATHHDALRLRFDRGDAAHEWRQRFTGTAASSVSLEVREHAPAAPTEVEELVRAANVAAHDALDVAAGPMLAARYLDLGGRGGRLVLVAHHLIIDQVSWSIVVDDLERAYRQLERGERVTLGAKTTSFKRWSERLAELGSAPERLADAAHWRALAEFVPQPIPVDHERGEMTVSTTRTVAASLDTEVTRRLLAEVPAAYRTQVNDVLLTALGEAFSACAGVDRLLVALEGHGREPLFDDVDLSRTVGWFTSMFPVALVRDRADPSSCLKATKEALRHIPHRGIGYGIHRELGEDRALRDTLAAAPTPQITFNYLGQMTAGHDRMFRVSPESAPQLWDPRLPQTSLLVVTCGVSEGRLQCTWDFSEARHRRETIEALATAFVSALERLVEHCTSPDHFGYTPSDFPLAGLGQAKLDALIGGRNGVEDVYPLTPLQAGMLFHSLGDERSGIYLVQLVLSLTGFDRAALVAAFAALIERHSIFRTYVVWESLLQVVVREADFALAEHDEPLEAFVREDRVRGFDLASAPLMRATLIRTGEQSGELVWTTHHVVTDGWSVGTVLADFLELYGAARAGRTASLPAVPRFRDYIAWLSSRAPDETNAFWQDRLAGFAAPTPLPIAGAVPLGWTADIQNGELQRRVSGLGHRVERAAKRHHTTASTLVHAAWGLLLARYTGEDDIVFGSVVSGRNAELPGVEHMIGALINTVPVRIVVGRHERISELLAHLHDDLTRSRAHEHISLTDAQRLSSVPAGTPLFHTLLAYENYPVDPAAAARRQALGITAVRGLEQTNFPLDVSVIPGDDLRLVVHYNQGLFTDAQIEQLVDHFIRVLAELAPEVGTTDRAVAEIDLLDADERRRIVAFASAAEAPSDPVLVPLRFEAQAARTPDAIAVVHEAERLSYGELDRRANQLAHHLLALDARPDRPVAVLLDRSVENVVALLGILKAGAPYLPIDPSNPPDRIRAILEDSGSRLIVGHAAGDIGTVRAVRFDVEHNALAARPATRPPLAIDPESLAYVIYTSGSTGRPKGVAIEHRGLANLVAWHVAAFEVSASSRATQIAALSFDASVWEIWPYLSCGASLHVVGDAIRIDPGALIEWLIANAITHCFLPTPLAESMIEQPRSSALALSILLVGGQALTRRPNVHHRFRMINCYGPTENTVVATAGEVSSVADGTLPPIGRPIGGVRTYVLDSLLAPVPRGVRGELFLGGVQLARGYLGRADLTAASFVPDPFGPPGSRLYRTGDLAQWRADGNLAFLGRIDHQVKVRGFRIELGEIEAALRLQPSVRDAVVTARDDSSGDQRLVAYVIAREDCAVAVDALRHGLAATLPSYMVPSAFVVIEQFPMTSTGKIDRKALPAPSNDSDRDNYSAPSLPIDQVMAAIWRQVLGVDRVGIDDDFFTLGGQSLKAMRVVAQVRASFDVELPLRLMFEAPTVSKLSAWLCEHLGYDQAMEEATLLLALDPIEGSP